MDYGDGVSVRLADGSEVNFRNDPPKMQHRYDVRDGYLLVLRYGDGPQRFVVAVYAPGGWHGVQGTGLADPADPAMNGLRHVLLRDLA